MKFEQGLCKSSLYDFKMLLWKDELNPRVRCAFGNVSHGRERMDLMNMMHLHILMDEYWHNAQVYNL